MRRGAGLYESRLERTKGPTLEARVGAEHGEGLATPRLPVGKDRDIIAVDNRRDEPGQVVEKVLHSMSRNMPIRIGISLRCAHPDTNFTPE